MTCDQCEALMVNGVFCHETGCPNSGARWNGEEWVAQRTCLECGCTVDKSDPCCDVDPTDQWLDDCDAEAACAVCCQLECVCPSCPTCRNQGDPSCYADSEEFYGLPSYDPPHGLVRTAKQVALRGN